MSGQDILSTGLRVRIVRKAPTRANTVLVFAEESATFHYSGTLPVFVTVGGRVDIIWREVLSQRWILTFIQRT